MAGLALFLGFDVEAFDVLLAVAGAGLEADGEGAEVEVEVGGAGAEASTEGYVDGVTPYFLQTCS